MAPPKKGDDGKTRTLWGWLKPSTAIRAPIIHRSRWQNNNDEGDEIVVASTPSTSRANSETAARSTTEQQPPVTAAPQTNTPTPRKRGRPRKTPTSSAPQSSASDASNTPRRRGRPRKSETQEMRDAQLRSSSLSSVPKSTSKKSPFNINPVTGEADVTPTKDSPYRSAEDTPSRRVAMGVDISSLKPASPAAEMPAPPPPPQFGAPSSTNTPTGSAPLPAASFSSISTLTSVPQSSQASGLPISSGSSRRVVTEGLQGVTNSDSDSEELLDLSTIVRKKRKLSPEKDDTQITSSRPAKPEPAKKSTRLSDQNKKSTFMKNWGTSPPKKKKYRNSLASLVADHESFQMSEAKIASLESAVAEGRRRDEQVQAAEDAGLDGEALLAAAGSDSEHRDRMIMALARTEALHDEKVFHFFLDTAPLHESGPFPVDSLPDEPWSKVYKDDTSRIQACISGFAAELAAEYPLPMPVTGWMVRQLMYEPDEVLCEAYVEILRASSVHGTSVSDTWASLNAVYKTRSLFENNWKEQIKKGLPNGLPYMIRVASFCAPGSDSVVSDALPAWTCAAFLDLALMNVDEDVKNDINLSMSIADAIEDMLDALPGDSFDKLIPKAVGTMFSPSDLEDFARYRAIAALPGSTPRSYKLRRRLALEVFSTTSRKDADSQDWARSIVRTLKTKPEFQISERTDYEVLMSLTPVLDIAVDCGWTNYSQLLPAKPSGPWGERPPPSEAENRHNSQIDAITNRLQAMTSRVRDAGTSHLRRTEAKGQIEQVIARLQHSVRSRPKSTKGIFDDKNERQATFKGTNFFRPFAATEPTQQEMPNESEQDSVEVIPIEHLSDREAEADDEGDGNTTSGAEHLPQDPDVSMNDGEPRYCYCHGPDKGRMLACDGKDCKRQWFHYECLGIEKDPEVEKWYCRDCRRTSGLGGLGMER